MTHWGWYWKHKKQHAPKWLCTWSSLIAIDSLKMFKDTALFRLVRESTDKTMFEIPKFNLVATLQEDYSLKIGCDHGSYVIPVEQKPCNYGGVYYFFHCPACNKRMRKLYCINGAYLCRKCAHLGYYSQRLRPSERCLYMQRKIEEKLQSHAGSLKQKPPWMKKSTFQKYRLRYEKYDEQYDEANRKELLFWYGNKIEPFLW